MSPVTAVAARDFPFRSLSARFRKAALLKLHCAFHEMAQILQRFLRIRGAFGRNTAGRQTLEYRHE
jgi:hypothetical protein